MDHFFLKGNEFLALVDRHSGMLSVHATSFKGARELLRILRLHCQKNGIPREVCSDGSSIFMAHQVQDFFKRYNIAHRVSSAGHPHSNNRGELAVKSLKRMLRDYVSGSGCLDSDAITQALLSHANTTCKILKVSPAELAFGRTLRDFFPRNVDALMPIPEKLLTAEAKELRQRTIRADMGRRLDLHTKVLDKLVVGDHVQMQNLRGAHPLKSGRSGVVVSDDGF